MNINHYNKCVSISEYIPELTIRGTSVSKDLGCGGYRLGWITFPKELNDLYIKCMTYISYTSSCTCVPVQYALNELLQDSALDQFGVKI